MKDSSFGSRLGEALHQAAKRAQRRYRLADYEDLRLRTGWLAPDPSAPFAEITVPVRPHVDELRTVLVFKPDEIGDAVHALPALRELRAHLPQARISLVCRALTRPLYERAGLVDEIATFEPARRPLRAPRRRRAVLAALGADAFDLAIFLRTNPGKFRDFLGMPARAHLHPLDPRMPSDSPYRAPVSLWGDERRHQSLQLLEIVGLLTGKSYSFADVRYPSFRWTDGDRESAREALGDVLDAPYVAVHPFVVEEARRYPRASWDRLLPLLDERLGPVTWVVVGGTQDGAFRAPANVVETQGRLALGATGFVLSQAAAAIGNLSGPVHWAAALGVPSVTLMSGHSLPAEWAPIGASLVVRADVPCAPCHRRTCKSCAAGWAALAPERIVDDVEAFLAPALARGAATEAVGEARG